MKTWIAGLLGLVGVFGVRAGFLPAMEPLYRDDFTIARGRLEYHGGNVWKIGNGRCHFAAPGHDRFAVVNVDDLRQMRVEAKITVERRLGPGWVMAGLALYSDPENHWRVLMVAGPEERRYFELVERHMGVHQAQHAPPPAKTRLVTKREGSLAAWEYGRTYRLALSVTPEAIVGEVRTEDGKEFCRTTATFGNAEAVRMGRPAMTAAGVQGSFQELAVEGEPFIGADVLQVPIGPKGNAAIVPDAANRVAPVLQGLLAKEGFGVRILSWDEMERVRLSGAKLALLVLADARRVPVGVARGAASYLRSRGKLIAIGAPAFGELLWKTPRGYVSADRYAEAIYDSLAKQPLPLSAAGWHRGAMKPTRRGTITQETDARAASAWKVSTDFEGWDIQIHPLEKGFGDGRPLLCFQAKGDARTPQLAIECNERDGSRWIATVEISPQWRKYVLWPADFLYWNDSPAKRGGPGDRFNPASAASIHVGLSVSHTPQCQTGEHTFWIADLATASDANVAQPEAQLPEIEGLYPSYKLYPLDRISSLSALRLLGIGRIEPEQVSTNGYSPVWREPGIGFDRGRPWRRIALVQAFERNTPHHGALVSLTVGRSVFPGAAWANVGVADPAELGEGPLSQALLPVVAQAAKAMANGYFLLEAGSRYFSYRRGEPIEVGASVTNLGRQERRVPLHFLIVDADANDPLLDRSVVVTVPANEQRNVSLKWDPPPGRPRTARHIQVTLEDENGETRDGIDQDIDLLPDEPAKPEDFVKVEGSHFTLGGKPWHMLGINYWPTSQGGRATLARFRRDVYDPVIIERDMRWMESMGINMLSGILAPTPDELAAVGWDSVPTGSGSGARSGQSPNLREGAFRDVHDFLERCRRHKIKVLYFLHAANPLAGGSFEAARRHIEAAGIKDHPAILGWELAWEPIYYTGPAGGQMDFLIPDWNAWIAERYGSVADAERDWGYKLPRINEPRVGDTLQKSPGVATPGLGGATELSESEPVALPKPEWCSKHGPWGKLTAAFRRFFSDHVGHTYGRMIRQLKGYDPKHLVTFRFGACGIPNQAWFAHSHSAGVAKHVDFLCPEGYNLQTAGLGKPTPADDLRKGGLVTLYYRWLSREKPVVWMEFGYTVNGIHTRWKTGMEHIKPEQLAIQRTEYENFYSMFLESGARGAAPWWLPGGFRLDERSDFGILEPDGSERPACEVLRKRLPEFAKVGDASCVAPAKSASGDSRPVMTLDLDAHYADAWESYAPQYLAHVKAGKLPYLRTAGTGSTSADCPLLAVGNTPLNGRNPPQFLNAEFNGIEFRQDGSPWREAEAGKISVKTSAALRCRVSVGNTAEAAWLAPAKGASDVEGRVLLRCTRQPSGKTLDVPIPKDTPYLADTEIAELTLLLSGDREQSVTFQMFTARRKGDGSLLTIPFGERRTVRISAAL